MDPSDEPTAEHSIDRELVDVFDTQSESEALVVKGLLEAAGIDAAIVTLDAPQDVLPGVGGMVVRVAAERADEARRIIDESREAAPDAEGADAQDTDLNGGSAA
ncbi:MAG: DUF2007 domain-containing protein [Acidobacteria bacterium]|nr:DUF2007 domain-containing protein [Acidobacteriota bacterium]